jgi:hypothetical protein
MLRCNKSARRAVESHHLAVPGRIPGLPDKSL